MVLNSEAPQKYVYSIESDEPVILDQSQLSEELKLIDDQTKEEFRISSRNLGLGRNQLIMDGLIHKAGHYLVYDGNAPIQSLSYNFPRKESNPDFLSEEEVNDQITANNLEQMQLIDAKEENFSEVLQDLNNGKQLWKLFIFLSIAFLLTEMLVIRLWK